MTQASLEDTLRSLVTKYGFEQVNESLREIGKSDRKSRMPTRSTVPKAGKGRLKVTAPQYVAKMKLQSKKKSSVVQLADKFQDKSFLPAFVDIDNFCRTYGIDEPASKSRASAVPRVFKFIASMETVDIQRIIDEGMFSGPARLGPIAAAIRRNSREGAATKSGSSSDEAS